MVARDEGRYDRQETIWDQDKLEKAKVLVVGAGTLGNEICKNLALTGIGHITIVDFDTIEEVNLNRCLFFREEDIGRKKSDVLAGRIRELNAAIDVESINCDINTDMGAGLFLGFDIVLGGLDNIMAREKINKYAYWTGTPYIDGAIEGLNGQMYVIIPPETACYACSIPPEMERTRNVHVSCSGTKLDSGGVSVPMVATTASVIGALQVQEAINIIHTGDSKLKGKQLWFDQAHSYRKDMPQRGESSVRYDLYESAVEKKKGCNGCKYYGNILKRIPLTEECTLQELLDVLRDELKVDPQVRNDELICYKLYCWNCKWEKPVFKLKKAIGIDINEMKCPECGNATVLDDSDDILRLECANRKMCEFGIPRKHILVVNHEIPIFLNGRNVNEE
jgi:molybdopterin/thiamine biosynthesis adenylyltransferase